MGLGRGLRRWQQSKGRRVNVRILILISGLLIATAARHFVTTSSGLTYTRFNATKYVSYNIVAFWLLIAVTVVLCLWH
jgi:uncharacterized membrane protein YidH (DUF202 family)